MAAILLNFSDQFRQIEELHQMANEKYSNFCDERARMQIQNGTAKIEPHQIAPGIQFKSLTDSFIPSSFELDLTNASPVLSNQKLAESEAIKLEHDDCKIEEIEEMQSESSLTGKIFQISCPKMKFSFRTKPEPHSNCLSRRSSW